MDMNLLKKFSFKSSRLDIKVIDKSFDNKLLDYQLANKLHFNKVLFDLSDNFYSLDYQRNFIEHDLDNIIRGNAIRFYLFEHNSDIILGDIVYYNILPPPISSALIGFKIDGGKRNNGFMKEGIENTLNFVFNQLNLHKIEAYIFYDNIAAIQLINKIGFVDDGIAKSYVEIKGTWTDHNRYYLLNPNTNQI